MTDEKRGWYVLRAISGKEAKVQEIIEASMKNTDLGNYVFKVLIPTEKVMAVRNGKKVIKEKNLYSGYVFIEAELTGEVIHTLTNTCHRLPSWSREKLQARTPPRGGSDAYARCGR